MKAGLTTFILAGILLTGVVLAENLEDLVMPGGKWWRNPRVATQLQLTSEEQSSLDTLYIENKRRMIDLQNIVEKERFELEQILDNPDFNEKACVKHFKKLTNAKTDLEMNRLEFLIDVRTMLGFDRFQLLKLKYQQHRLQRVKRFKQSQPKTPKSKQKTLPKP